MKHIKFTFMSIAAAFILFGCKSGYVREDGCHLDKMGISGNVVKVETIVQSSMPLTELYAKAFDPKYAISTYVGNICIEFDYNGNIRHSAGYGIDGKQLFDESSYTPDDDACTTPGIPLGPGANQKISRIETVSSGDGHVTEVRYYDGDGLVWTQKATYNSDGTVNSIIKNYESLRIKTDLLDVSYADTTTYSYISYDSLDNWTEAEVVYKGILPKHAHSYRIKRQITYSDEDPKPSLMKELKDYNKVVYQSTDDFDETRIGDYGIIRIPHYMAMQSEDYINEVNNYSGLGNQMNYLFMSVYDKNDAYASFSVNLSPGDGNGFDDMTSEDLEYDEETDKYIEETITDVMAQGGTYILKWLPYQFVNVSGRRALRYRYYRYGNGSPIPVYCENYTIPMQDGNTINLVYSFQSNLDYRFRKPFDEAVRSIRFY